MKQAVIKFEIDDYQQQYIVIGNAINSKGEVEPVGFCSDICSRAYDLFDWYNIANGFECQKVIIRKV